jgi:hypothetical protein
MITFADEDEGNEQITAEPLWIPPDGLKGVLEFYGNIYSFIREDGSLKSSWFSERAAYVTVPWDMRLSWAKDTRVKRIVYHARIPTFEAFIHALHNAGLGQELKFYGGGFNFRPQRGNSGKISTHAFLAAWDFNPEENGLGTKGKMNPKVVKLAKKYGFIWGGDFTRPDPMHFQAASGY